MAIVGKAVTGTFIIPMYPSQEAVPEGEEHFCLTTDSTTSRDQKALAYAAVQMGKNVTDLHYFSSGPETGGKWGVSCGYQA